MDALKSLIDNKKRVVTELLQKQGEKKDATVPSEAEQKDVKEKQPSPDTPLAKRQEMVDPDSLYDIEEIRKEVLKEIEQAKRVKPDEKDEEPVLLWNFSVTDEEINSLKEQSKKFKERFDSHPNYKRKFDFAIDKTYAEKCEEVRVFVIQSVEAYDKHLKEKSQVVDKSSTEDYLRELDIFKTTRSDLVYLVKQLQDQVS